MVHAKELRTTSLKNQMEIGRACRKTSPRQMGADNDYVEPLQRQAKYRMGRLLQRTSGTTLFQSGESWKWVEIVGKSQLKIILKKLLIMN